MTCEHVKLPGGGSALVCTRGSHRRARCSCGLTASRLCDWKIGEGKTCDAPLCPACSHTPAPGKDLCAEHAAEWAAVGQVPVDRNLQDVRALRALVAGSYVAKYGKRVTGRQLDGRTWDGLPR